MKNSCIYVVIDKLSDAWIPRDQEAARISTGEHPDHFSHSKGRIEWTSKDDPLARISNCKHHVQKFTRWLIASLLNISLVLQLARGPPPCGISRGRLDGYHLG